MTEKMATTKRRAGRAKPMPFTYLPPDRQKEYYELSLNAAPTETEALNGSLNGYSDTGGYIFSHCPSAMTHPDWRSARCGAWVSTAGRHTGSRRPGSTTPTGTGRSATSCATRTWCVRTGS